MEASLPKITCQLCFGKFRSISNTHLWKEHKVTPEEYKKDFPMFPLMSPDLCEAKTKLFKGKSYEELIGKERGGKLRESRKITTSKQMEDPKQIQIRREKSFKYERTKECREAVSKWRTTHGYNSYRSRALDFYGLECARCGFTSEEKKDFWVHHIDFLNIPSELGNHKIENLQVLCRSCHSKLHKMVSSTTQKFVGLSSIERGMHYILKGLKDELGLDLNDEHLRDTPKRVSRAYAEIFEGVKDTKKQISDILSSSFSSDIDEIIISKDIEVFSMCPHHFLPVHYILHVCYLPSKGGKILGISKLSRLAVILSKRPVIQEQFTQEIVDNIMSLEGCQGAGCVVIGNHYCMSMRGIKQPNSKTITSCMGGIFRTDQEARAETMRLLLDKTII